MSHRDANTPLAELCELLEALCEGRLESAQAARLEQLVIADPAARRLYLDYIELHGSLYWDAAIVDEGIADGGATRQAACPAELPLAPRGAVADACSQPAQVEADAARPAAIVAVHPGKSARRVTAAALGLCAALLVAIGLAAWGVLDFGGGGDGAPRLAKRPRDPVVPGGSHTPEPQSEPAVPPRVAAVNPERPAGRGEPPSPPTPPTPPATDDREGEGPAPVAEADIPPGGSSTRTIVAFIDSQLQAGWEAAGIAPSPIADDSEWLRRVYLDLAGHVPPVEEVERFLADRSSDKRVRLVERLLDHPDFARHWGTVWTNLLVGRTQGRDVDREGLERFLRQGFGENRPWNEMVAELVTAEGSPEENGAAGFLLAHLNNEAVPATAVTARVFLGMQVQCTQCHNHPFNDWQQSQFWDLNAFFKQTAAIDVPGANGGRSRKLVTKAVEGPLYYETRQGLMRVAYPRFEGEPVDSGPGTNRRAALAQLMSAGDKPQLAVAFVNRLWALMFGYGFTNPVDDMGPHNPPTHPALLDRLAREFVASGFDTRQLIRWITASRAYQATSRITEANSADDPERGEAPLFSRMYARPMSPEQLYDSLVVATRPRVAGGPDWREAHLRRREWLAQFIHDFGTEENDEATSFGGTVPQALMLMNGELTAGATSARRGTFLAEALAEPTGDAEKIRKLWLAALSRYPTPEEQASVRRLLRTETREPNNRRAAASPAAVAQGLEDLFWALLNSSEFVHVH